MKMPKSSVSFLWEPWVLLVLGSTAVLINPSLPLFDVITNVIGGLLLVVALLLLLIDSSQDLT
ncbi:MAG: hypothetical protein IH587_05490 [Anaerolineae bacterium]|nr:hypothetical protein [Anaerolineae bacterium]